jgi:hypothetical protein
MIVLVVIFYSFSFRCVNFSKEFAFRGEVIGEIRLGEGGSDVALKTDENHIRLSLLKTMDKQARNMHLFNTCESPVLPPGPIPLYSQVTIA